MRLRLPVRARADLALTLLALAALLAWDASGWDLTVARHIGSAAGFAWRDTWWASRVMHDGGRWAAWALLLTLAWAALRAPQAGTALAAGPSGAERWRWIAVMLACVVAVPALKRVSGTSCPWDLSEFGGVAAYVSHWRLGLLDGGPGHCFPSGHAVAAFAFFGLYFMWREHDPRRARAWLVVVVVAGLVFGGAQLLRGAHHPSHTLWSAWLCWALNAAAAQWPRTGRWQAQPA
ncbi:MAG: phosphatase PAP2 family protein [Rubrivivax sp.]|nr:phosphatase PAP2 family protein [Rubrivivax sp.]